MMVLSRLFLCIAALSATFCVRPATSQERPASAAEFVILISVDGLRPEAVANAPVQDLPNLHRLRMEGVSTDNARTDYDYSNTIPNHLAQLTGRPVKGLAGHNWTRNVDPADGETVHANNGAYVSSIFDVVHDHGLRTAGYVSKSKFSLIDVSYGPEHGAPDTIGVDNGRDKIDDFHYEADTERLVERLLKDMKTQPANFTLLHLRDTDSAGHTWGWSLRSTSRYMRAVRRVDEMIGRLIAAVESDRRLADNTAIILTADHGGSGRGHGNQTAWEHYTIPFYVWGQAIGSGNLYALNSTLLEEPARGRPDYSRSRQPVRNGAAANVAASLLGLPNVPGSTIGANSPIEYTSPAR